MKECKLFQKILLALAFTLACGSLASATSLQQSFPAKYDKQIKKAAKLYWPNGPDWLWLKAQYYAESALDPDAKSPVGAMGIAQIMPGTWRDLSKEMALGSVSPWSASASIKAGAFYMAKMRHVWRRQRTTLEAHYLALASYNAGVGNILKAQALCKEARMWPDILPCLPSVTGRHSKETINYVARISRYQIEMRAKR